mmetsp:Transcript_70395/g.168603  ORF Transcript_70395/g.168603 Transcript_70395/m.168603 type:complete len:1231 (-) Transcript_70395:127-3819(-)
MAQSNGAANGEAGDMKKVTLVRDGVEHDLSWPARCTAADLEGEIRRLFDIPCNASFGLELLLDDGDDSTDRDQRPGMAVVLSPALPQGRYRVSVTCPFPQVRRRDAAEQASSSQGVVAAAATASSSDCMPIVSVTLFKHGAAQIVRAKKLADALGSSMALELQLEDMNAVLRTLHIEPRACVQSVTYDSACAPSSQLREASLDPPKSLGDLLLQLRGAQVVVTVGGSRQSRGACWSIAGRILTVTGHGLHLLTDASGIVPVDVGSIQHLEFPEPAVQAEYSRLLAAQVSGLEHGKKTLKIHTRTAAPGVSSDAELSASYLVQAAVWKTSYRLLVARAEGDSNQEEKLQLTGWALLDNTSQDDWNDIKLTLVSGQPNRSFCDVYSPVLKHQGFALREWVREMKERKVSSPDVPFSISEGFAQNAPAAAKPGGGLFQNAAAAAAGCGGGVFANNAAGGGLFGGGFANAGGFGGGGGGGGLFGGNTGGGTFGANTGGGLFGANTGGGLFGSSSSNSGGGASFGGGGGGCFGGAAAAAAPSDSGGAFGAAAPAQASLGFGSSAPAAAGFGSSSAPPPPAQGAFFSSPSGMSGSAFGAAEIAAAAEDASGTARGANSEASALFSYSVPQKLSVAAKSSATVPIFEGEALNGTVNVVVDSINVATPKSAVLFRNSKALTLEAGPVCIFEQDGSGVARYLGEGFLPFTLPGEQRSLEFGAESRLKVRRFIRSLPDSLTHLKVVAGSGTVQRETARRRIVGYSLRNTSDEQLLSVRVLHHASHLSLSGFGTLKSQPQWRPTMHKNLVERRPPNIWIYEVKVEPRSSVLLQVIETCKQTTSQFMPEESSFYTKLAADVGNIPPQELAKLKSAEQQFQEIEELALKLRTVRRSIEQKAQKQQDLLDKLRGTEAAEQLTSWKTQVGKELEVLQREGGLEEQQMLALQAEGTQKEEEVRKFMKKLSIDFRRMVSEPIACDPGVPEELPHQPLLQSSAMKSRVFPSHLDLSLAPSQLLQIDTKERTVEQVNEAAACDDGADAGDAFHFSTSDGWEVVPSELAETDAARGSLGATVRANVGLSTEDLPQEGLWPLVEVNVLAEGCAPDGIVVGLVEESTETSAVGSTLGSLPSSVGLSSDGCLLTSIAGSQVQTMLDSFGWNDAVGIIWDGASQSVTFTKNGRPVPRSTAKVPHGRWFIAVSLRSRGARLRLNFGQQPFSEGICGVAAAAVQMPPLARLDSADL